MAISFVNSGIAAAGSTSLSIPYPASLQARDLLVCCICNKYPNNAPSIPSGWTMPPDCQTSAGAGASGIDTGSVYGTVFFKLSDGTESGNLSVTITSGNSAVGRMFAYRVAAGKYFALAWAKGSDTSAGTDWSVTANVNPGIEANDWILVCSAINSDNYTYLSEALSATGITLGSETERQDSGTNNGQDCGLVVSDHVVSTGPATAAPVFTMTANSSAASSPAGVSIFLRMREVGDISQAALIASNVWPSRAAFSTSNFVDHFPGSSLDSRWTSRTTNTGSVTVTDSYVDCASGGTAGSADFFYKNTKLDKTKNFLITVCVNRVSGGPSNYFMIYNNASSPTEDTYANFNANVRAYAALDDTGLGHKLTYFDAAHNAIGWNGSTSQWVLNEQTANSPVRNGDWYILGFENDGANNRFRMMSWGQSYASGYTFEQGLRMFALSDWVPWQSVETSTDLWLVLGNPYTSNGATHEFRYEWVRYAEATTPIEAWCAAKLDLAAVHRIRHYYSHDGVMWVPEDRTLWALNLGAAAPDDAEIQEPCVVWDGASTDYLFYTGTSGGVQKICVAKATHATPQMGPWTRGGSNPIISVGTAGANDDSQTGFPFVVMDKSEADPNKRWKMLYSGRKTADSKWRLMYATAADPPDSSTWTKQATVIDVGGSGAADENAARDACVLWFGNQWEVWYEAWASSGATSVMRATGTDLVSLTKDGSGARVSAQANGTTTLTANLTGNTVTVSSTTGFSTDGFVVLDQDSTQDNYGVSRVRKVASGTSLELYHGLDGFTTTAPCKIRQVDAIKRFTPRFIIQVGSEWWFYLTFWGSYDDDATFRGLLELTQLLTHSNASPSGATPAINHLGTPIITGGFNNDKRSLENITLRMEPVVPWFPFDKFRQAIFRSISAQ